MTNYTNSYNYMERIERQRYARTARVKQIKRQKIMLVIGLFITILLITLFSLKAFVYANDKATDNGTKMFKSTVIYCGDTVNSIAEENYIISGYSSVTSYEKEIRSINHLSNDTNLIPGNYIVLPYFN